MHALYKRLQDLSRDVARNLAQPDFYRRFTREIAWSEQALAGDGPIRECRGRLDESLLECAHGLCHCEAVARDAGALVMIEGRGRRLEERELSLLAQAAIIAGLLHDIKRREQDHAVRGSLEAEKILNLLAFDRRLTGYITYAIRNHEAFKKTCDLGDEAGCLISDALYDADKFRWGPENFTTTLWLMVNDRSTPPEQLHGVFQEKMKGIASIKETFRTATGRRYGPEIIEQGISIGNAIYKEMTVLLQQQR
ncbi:MAG: hypothetical protein OEW15_14460 [Nitrospirota bacterium]|nr:hypothetical protein [Nitrospirota bacterium]